MPAGQMYRYKPKKGKRRNYKRVANSRQSGRLRYPFSGPIPNSKLVRLRYVETISINATTGLAGTYKFKANDIFDPNNTGAGHQPYGHDELASMYINYTVIGSKCTAKFFSGSNSIALSAANVGILLKDEVTTESNTTLWMERPKSRFKTIANNSGGSAVATMSKNFSAKKFFDVRDLKDSQDRLGASFGTSPTDSAYFHIIVAPANTAIDLADMYITVVIDYLVICSKPKELIQS